MVVQIKTEDKSNEITSIIEKKADYILALKKNQETLYYNVELFFDSIIKK